MAIFSKKKTPPIEGGEYATGEELGLYPEGTKSPRIKPGPKLSEEIRALLIKDPKTRSKKDFYDLLADLNRYESQGRSFHRSKEERKRLLNALDAQYGDRAKDTGPFNKPNIRDITEDKVTSPPPDRPILDGDDEKKTFFQKLFSKENRPFLENLGMQLGTNLTAPMNPGENRSLINQVATSIQGASDKTAAQETADVTKLLNAAKAKEAFSKADGGTDLYKKAVEYVTSLYPNIKSTDPAYGKYLAQAMNKFGVKDITTAQVNAFVKLSQMESELGMLLDKDSAEYKKKTLEIQAFKKRLDEGGIGGSSGDGRKIATFEDVQDGD
tara:strand:+ start:817 stop:1794 length:978 start_codon:yes stop_codon:yes gene_type:complete